MKFTIEHLGIMSRDPRALAEWYISVLGFFKLYEPEGEGMPVFVKEDNGVVIEFFSKPESYSYPDDMSRKNQHLCLYVDDFDGAVAHLEEAGTVFPDSHMDIFMGGKVRFFQDPEGNWIHLVHRPVKPW